MAYEKKHPQVKFQEGGSISGGTRRKNINLTEMGNEHANQMERTL